MIQIHSMNINTQETKEEKTREMMRKFNDLNASYNKMAENSLSKKKFSYDYIDTSQDTDIENIIIKMNIEFKNATSEINSLQDQILQLKCCENKYNKIIENLNQCNNLQNEFINVSKIIDMNINIKDFTLVSFTNHENIKVFDKILLEINNKITDNERKISELTNIVSCFRKLFLRTSEIHGTANRLTCTICYCNQISHCLNPCGHTFCKTCIDKMGATCSSCRSSFQTKIKMFITENLEDETEINDNSGFSFNRFGSGIVRDSSIITPNTSSNIIGAASNPTANSDFYSWMPLS